MFGRKTLTTGIDTRFYFESMATSLDSDTFSVVGFEGEEEISRPYRFEIELASENPEIDADEVIQWPAWLGIKRDGKLRKIHGVIIKFQQKQAGPHNLYFYRAVLAPRLWLMSLSRQNQIYQNNSVPRILEKELKGASEKHGSNAVAALTEYDYELRLKLKCPDPVMTIVGDVCYFDPGEYPTREYTVQYNESDLEFISRLMEHEGIFYFFEHDEEKEKLIIADDNDCFPAIAKEGNIVYRPPSAMVPEEETVQAFSCQHRRIPNKVILRDYNYRKPHLPLQAEAYVDPEGCGLVSEYGNHFKVPEEGHSLAEIRAQEICCRQKVFVGEGDCSRFQAGYRYTLDEHYRENFNREYVITRVRHSGVQPLAGVNGLEQGDKEETFYRNEFTAIPSDVVFRPERKTPKPKINANINATVDASGDGKYAEIDEQGRYKVRLPFDLSGKSDGKASRWVRMAQPYAGSDYGMHFPLHKGTEVLLTFVDGDPDRPIISGSVPNPGRVSPVTSENQTKSVIRDNYGNELVFDATPGDEHIRLQTPHHNSGLELGKSINTWTTSDDNSAKLGNQLEIAAGMKTEVFGGMATELKAGMIYDLAVGTTLEFNLGGTFKYEHAWESVYSDGPITNSTKMDILSLSKRDQVLGAGHGLGLVGGSSADQGQDSRTIANLYHDKLTLSAGPMLVRNKETSEDYVGQLYEEYLPEEDWHKHIGFVVASILAIIPMVTGWFVPEQKEDETFEPNWTHIVSLVIGGLAFLTSVPYGVGRKIWEHGDVQEKKIEPVEHVDPAAVLEMNKNGEININSNGNEKKEIVLGVGEKGQEDSKIEMDDKFIILSCKETKVWIDNANGNIFLEATDKGAIEIRGKKNVYIGSDSVVKLAAPEVVASDGKFKTKNLIAEK